MLAHLIDTIREMKGHGVDPASQEGLNYAMDRLQPEHPEQVDQIVDGLTSRAAKIVSPVSTLAWTGAKPESCNFCGRNLEPHGFVNGQTSFGVWCIMCHGCHASFGVGLGDSKGKRYRPDGSGGFEEVE